MLKWLKQKPTGHSSHEVSKSKIITDDPLATLYLQQKKSKNKSEETQIYAVSRVNPLFEEENINHPKAIVSGCNNSGSSGYDSGSASGVPSDDDEQKYNNGRTDACSTSSTSSFTVVNNRAPQKLGQLFRDDDDRIVHHQAALLSSDGRPVLHIVEQNPDFVQSIAVQVGGGGKIEEATAHHYLNKDARKSARKSTKVSIHPVPNRNSDQEDNVGVAKLIHKESRYVHSIVIGGSPEGKSSVSRLVSTTTSSACSPPPPPLPPLIKKQSVTFSERVELVADTSNGKVLIKAQSPPYRKTSNEQDSIVTESLLLLTSSKPVSHGRDLANQSNPSNLEKGNNGNNRLSHSSKSGERKVSDSSSSRSGDQIDLEAFSSSIRKNHPVKHILSNRDGKSLEINHNADHYSSTDYLDHEHHHHQHHHQGGNKSDDFSSCEIDGQGLSYDTEETRSSSQEHAIAEEEKRSNRRPRNQTKPSPFGGIADHYAAAKEIAKEIESYSNGANNTKTNSKKSIVRDLLSGRGREALAFHTAIRKNNAALQLQQQQKSEPSSSPRHSFPISNDAIDQWESVRVQQVYLKGRSWKEIEPNSSSSSSSQEGDRFGYAGQRVLSVTQQGQVHSNKKDTLPSTNSSPSTHSFAKPIPPPSPSKQQHLKGSIFGSDGRSSEGNNGDDDASSDSGNSTDRNSKGNKKSDLLPQRRAGPSSSRSKPVKPPDPSQINPQEEALSSGGLSQIDKVMIVTGDSQNMVVDLSGVPQDLRDAIISGTALITLPDGLKNSSKKGGYTIVSLPTTSTTTPSKPNANSTPNTLQHTSNKTSENKRLPSGTENEIKALSTPSTSTNLNLNVHQLERGELHDQIFNNYAHGNKNKTQIWNVMQQSVQQTLIEGANGKKKRITTVLPFHPNQDVYKSPDFTMEGQRLEQQKKKLDIAKKRRCACRVFGIFFFLATFIGVLVTLSMIYTKGQRYFGSV